MQKKRNEKAKPNKNEKENHELGTSGLDRGIIIEQATQENLSS